MPKRHLDSSAVQTALDALGINQANLAGKLDVSRETVSKWISGRSAPRPRKLLDLALILGRDIDEISHYAGSDSEPIIAFRKKGASKITNEFIAHAQHMGRLLAQLTPYLPFDQIVAPATLKDPNCDFDYLEAATSKLRKKLRVDADAPLDFPDLVGVFRNFQAVLVPVMWGERKNHRNALHIYLPESTTTWVYLNLDSNVFDFLFWMAHELGHVLSPQLRNNEAEDFADAFAGALLFPRDCCVSAHRELLRKRSISTQLQTITKWAKNFGISPITVDRRLRAFATATGAEEFNFGNRIYQVSSKLNKQYLTVKEALLGESESDATNYIQICKQEFATPFFGALAQHIRATDCDSSYIQSILDITVADAKAIRSSLC